MFVLSDASTASIDAVTILVADHNKVKNLFKEFKCLYEGGAARQAERLARQICNELTIHVTVEEEIFYPEARAAIGDSDRIAEAKAERATAKQLIAQIMDGSIADDKYAAQVSVLGEYINHHISEEQGKLFPRAQNAGLDMDEIGARILARKQDLEAELGSADDTDEIRFRSAGMPRETARRIGAGLRSVG